MEKATPKLRKKSITIVEQACHEIHGFSQHILPKGFVRIRHYGLLSASKRAQLRQLQTALGVQVPQKKEKKDWKQLCREHLGFDPDQCPECKQGQMVVVQWLAAGHGPPEKHNNPLIMFFSFIIDYQLLLS